LAFYPTRYGTNTKEAFLHKIGASTLAEVRELFIKSGEVYPLNEEDVRNLSLEVKE